MAKKMTLTGTFLKWGNSYGIRVSKEDVKMMNLVEKQRVKLDVQTLINPLRELWGADIKISKKDIKEFRKSMESKWDV